MRGRGTVLNKITEVYHYFFPCRDIHDRRERVAAYNGINRRHADTLSSTELKKALNNQFDSLATTITHAKDINNE
jgi:hypothetical protein